MRPHAGASRRSGQHERSAPALLEARGVTREFRVGGGLLGRSQTLRAVDDVDLDVAAGEVLTVVGESGSGKTTLGRCLLGLMRPTAGSVRFDGDDVGTAGRARTSFRRRVQPIFQNPYSSLDPRWPVARDGARAARRVRRRHAGRPRPPGRPSCSRRGAVAAPRRLPPTSSPAGSASGSRSQRRWPLGPDLIVADEPVSALDVLVQAQILNLLATSSASSAWRCVFITHDLAVVEHIADRVAVMYLGKIVEAGPADDGALASRSIRTRGRCSRRSPSPTPVAGSGACRARRDPEPARTAGGLPLPPPLPARDRRLPRGRAGDDGFGSHVAACHVTAREHPIERSANADRIGERHRHQLQAGRRRRRDGRARQRARRRPRDLGAARWTTLLAAGYRVLRFDNRGVGASSAARRALHDARSSPTTRRRSSTSSASPDFHLMGVSMGGMIAQEYAIAYRRRPAVADARRARTRRRGRSARGCSRCGRTWRR